MLIKTEEEKIYTPDEYLDFEVNSDTRHEYINGEILPMTGGTPEHNEIASILNAALRMSLKGKSYSIFIADQRLWIPDYNLYTYPDIMVAPRPLQRQQGRTDTITNPVMIAEVLSNSTKSFERDEKFSAYRTIPTFQEYLLIDQYTPHVEEYFKTDFYKWIFTEYEDIEAYISLSSIACEIYIRDLYDGIEFES